METKTVETTALNKLLDDKARLEYLIETGDSVSYRGHAAPGWVVNDALARWTPQAFADPRTAIDHAIQLRMSLAREVKGGQ